LSEGKNALDFDHDGKISMKEYVKWLVELKYGMEWCCSLRVSLVRAFQPYPPRLTRCLLGCCTVLKARDFSTMWPQKQKEKEKESDHSTL
jgi:hypothetical protein